MAADMLVSGLLSISPEFDGGGCGGGCSGGCGGGCGSADDGGCGCGGSCGC